MIYDTIDANLFEELRANGLSMQKVAERMGIPRSRLDTWWRFKRRTQGGRKCAKCMYRSPEATRYGGNCDYILIMHESRKCPPENCDKFKEGKPKKQEWKLYETLEDYERRLRRET